MYIGIILLVIAICYPFIFKYIEQYLLQKGKNAAQKIFVIFNTNLRKEQTLRQKKT